MFQMTQKAADGRKNCLMEYYAARYVRLKGKAGNFPLWWAIIRKPRCSRLR